MRALARQIFFFPIEKWVKKQHFIAFQTLHTFKAYSGNLSLFLILVLSSFYFFLLLFVVVLLFVLKTPSVLPVPVGGKQGLFFCLMYQYCQCGLGAGFQPAQLGLREKTSTKQTNKQQTAGQGSSLPTMSCLYLIQQPQYRTITCRLSVSSPSKAFYCPP